LSIVSTIDSTHPRSNDLANFKAFSSSILNTIDFADEAALGFS
jgi:hypothetical protein